MENIFPGYSLNNMLLKGDEEPSQININRTQNSTSSNEQISQLNQLC